MDPAMKTTKAMRDLSDVEVIFLDGEVKTYRISASPHIGGYLAQQAGQTGILSLFNNDESYAVPLDNVREWAIRSVTVEVADEDENA